MSLEFVICVLRFQLHSKHLSLYLISHWEDLRISQVLVDLVNQITVWLHWILVLIDEYILRLVLDDRVSPWWSMLVIDWLSLRYLLPWIVNRRVRCGRCRDCYVVLIEKDSCLGRRLFKDCYRFLALRSSCLDFPWVHIDWWGLWYVVEISDYLRH